jgi:hypothetical protein
MLDIMKTQSDNNVFISGILNELEIVEGTTKDGRDWIRGTANILVDQEINGIASENIIPVKMFSMRLKKDGTENKVYNMIQSYKEDFTSRAAAEDINDASQVTVNASVEENIWIDQRTGKEVTGFQISSNFLKKKRDSDTESATFQLSGVVIKTQEEMDRNDEPTGRLIVKFGVIGWAGKINILTLVAEGNAKAHIEQNWADGDTVKVAGRINMTQKVEKYTEEQGFGEPIERVRTISKRELVITGGSQGGLDEEYSYDADSVKKACVERLNRIEEMKNNQSKAAPKAKSDAFDF